MSLLKFLCGSNTSTTYHYHAFLFSSLSHYSLHFVLLAVIVKVSTITKKDKHAFRNPYQTLSKTKIMSEIEEVQEQMKADTEATKNQMTSMMEAMLSMRQIMENNAVVVATNSVAAEADPTHPSAINQANQPIPDMVGQGGEVLGSTGSPHIGKNRNAFPYGLPIKYTPHNAMHMPNENTSHFVPIQGQQPQLGRTPFAQPLGKPVKILGIMLWVTSNYTLRLPLRDQHVVVCPLNHKGLPHRTYFLHNLVPPTIPIPAQDPIWEGIFQ